MQIGQIMQIGELRVIGKPINPFMHNFVKWPKYVWPFYNIMHERVKETRTINETIQIQHLS